jgi:two-component system phosphate regulon sensor histidine kinase PhoR
MLRKVHWRIAIPYLLLIVALMLTLGLYLSARVRQVQIADLEAQLTAEAGLLAEDSAAAFAQQDTALLGTQAHHWAELLQVRVTLIAADGTVLGESHKEQAQPDNHLYRPEVQQALAHGQGSSIRFSNTVGYDMLYVARPVTVEGAVVGFVRLALSLEQVEAHVARLREAVVVAMLVTTALAGILAVLLAGRITQPIRALTRVAERIVGGDLQARLFLFTRDEVGQLATAFNRMADHMQEELEALEQGRSRLAAILENMADGVVITDAEGQVVLVNPAAAALLGTVEPGAPPVTFAQLARHHQLIELWKRCAESDQEQVDLFELSPQTTVLQAIITPFQEAGTRSFLVILQDLTRVRKLERMRSDFVSNVSHELRTPLASLKALVDTLRDGALEDPPAAQHFLSKIEVEVDALTQLVTELLELTRIESGRAPLQLRPVAVAEIVGPPVERLTPQAERAALELRVHIPDNLPPVLADAERARQVVTNLVHNAIKFTPSGEIEVSARQQGDEIVISVRDTGVGLSDIDLPRIFERFYKADRARSGGGTGLGLALAKHIVHGHGGRIWAESVEGRGSTFSFTLPAVSPTITNP